MGIHNSGIRGLSELERQHRAVENLPTDFKYLFSTGKPALNGRGV